MRAVPVVVLAVSLLACRGDDGNSDDDTDNGDESDLVEPDADDGDDVPLAPECDPLGARTPALEAFVAPTGLQTRVQDFIDDAQDTLDVQMYLFTVDAIATRIIAAKNRGVDVRVLLDPDHEGNPDVRGDLSAAGVANRDAPNLYEFSHAKYMIADGDRALIMSANFNVDAFRSERNYGVIDRDPDDLEDLIAIFNMDWASGGGEPPMPANLMCTRLIVSPNNSFRRVIDLIDSAEETLDVEALYVSETGTREAIVAAKERGVSVRVIIEGSADSSMAQEYFEAAGITVHDANTFSLHAKLIIADGVAFVGSQNYSTTALTRNREIGVFVTEASQVAVIQTQFDADFSSTN